MPRFPAALHDGYFGIDELSIEDLLAFTARLAGSIQFRDVANLPASTWDRFVQSDELFHVGRLLAINLRRQREDFLRQLVSITEATEGSEQWWAGIESLPSIRLARTIDDLFAQLRVLPSVAAVRAKEKIENVIAKSLAAEIQALKRWCHTFDQRRAAVLFVQFRGVWETPPGRAPTQSAGEFLRGGFNAFYSAIQHLQGNLRGEFALSLQRPDHDPAVAVLVAFLQLRQKVQGRLNQFAARQLDLYYDQVLRIASRPVVPDRAVLLLLADAAGREVLVPAGTMFSGGLDANRQDRLYKSTADLRVTDARIAELHSFWFERSAGVSPENSLWQIPAATGMTMQYATSARVQDIFSGDARFGAIGDGARPANSLFGHREANRAANRGRYAELGIAIASRALAMKQGTREILVTFEFASQAGETTIDDFVGILGELLGTTKADSFFKAFRNAFQVSITEESGWYVFSEYLPTSQCVDPTLERANTLCISLRLPADVGAIVPVNPLVHGAKYFGSSPIIRFQLDEAYLFPYSLFVGMTLARVRIDVKVGGCRDVVAYNQLGRLSTVSQFYPFGATPVVGDYLILGCEEAASKVLTSFELDIAWAGLPSSLSGFSEQYRGYPTKYSNESFKARLSALSDRHWLPSNERDRIETDLFATKSKSDMRAGGAVNRRQRIDLAPLCKHLRPEANTNTVPFGYDVSTRSGFVKLTLSAPETGFGHREYPLALSSVVAKSSRKSRLPLFGRFRKEKAPEPLPMAPYTPVIDHLLVNYSAREEIDLRYSSGAGAEIGEKVFHIHPTGIEPMRPGRPDGVRLVPWYREDGHLLIGITATELKGPLTLFFHLKDDCRPVREYRDPNFCWYYLAADEWLPLAPERVLSDRTYGFLKSGIVSLDIPADATADNRICRSGLYWLRVSAYWDDVANVCSLFSIHTHAIEVVWQPSAENAADQLQFGLKAGTISQGKGNISGIRGIQQPVASWGGKSAESRKEKILRTSERLRHKQRAVTASDYEKLVLHEFPDLHHVRCFPCCGGNPESPFAVSPGEVFVVVVPQLVDGSQEASGPMVDAYELNEIGKYISTLNSGIASVRVSNPDYEQIQVRCKVRLKEGQNPGDGIATITRHLGAFLSPWSREAKIPPFGWRIRCIDLQAHLQSLHSVTLASGVSVLRISAYGEGRKRLSDTARNGSDDVVPRLPWSVAVPFAQHLIEVVYDSQPRQPSLAGFGNLAIGSTFIGTREGDD